MACTDPKMAWLPNDRKGRPLFREPIGGDQFNYHVGALPCQRCTECRAARARDWSIRMVHEAMMHDAAGFLTLTYDSRHLPHDRGLHKRDFQLFMKRLRRAIEPMLVRFVGVGEYGGRFGRPHYHACVFGHGFPDQVQTGRSSSGHDMFRSAELDRIWGQGMCTVQDLTTGTAAYCAQYCLKSAGEADPLLPRWRRNADGIWNRVEPEFLLSSRRPGIGATWLDAHYLDAYGADPGMVIVGDQVRMEMQTPRFYDKRFEERDPEGFARMKAERIAAGLGQAKDATPARLAVRAEVREAKRRERSAF